jgi:hypothetical protein
MSAKTIELGCYGIVVELTGDGGASITSDLKEGFGPSPCQLSKDECDGIDNYNYAMDGIESLIINHAVAGIDITTPAYLEGIESAVQGCANNMD